MTALKGSLSYTRFFVVGDLPPDLAAFSMKRIRANSFLPLVPDEDDTQHHGWCSITDSMDTDLDHEKVFWNEYVVLGLRIDTWVVPKPLLLAHLRNAEAALLEKKGLEKIGRKARQDLKMMVTKKLRKQLVPSSKSIDLVWNVHAGIARLFATSPKIQLAAQELFEKTFKLQMVPESPGTRAERVGLEGEKARVWENLAPTSLAVEGDAA